MKDDTPIMTDQSQVHRTYLCIYGTVGICLFGYIIMTIRYILNTHTLPWMDIITEVIILLALLSISMTRSSYELHKKDIVITCSSLFRTRTLRIPYKMIDGVHHFKVEPIKSIAYKHTYRMYGSMDRRDIWSLVYNLPHTDKVSRVLMKASEDFWLEFAKLLPRRIRVSQEEVLAHAFRHISGVDEKQTAPENAPKETPAAPEGQDQESRPAGKAADAMDLKEIKQSLHEEKTEEKK